MTPQALEKLREAMDWVIPPDASPGAGTSATLQHLLELIAREGLESRYTEHLDSLTVIDLANPHHPLGPLLVEHVRDAYYANADSGAWADIGFVVTG